MFLPSSKAKSVSSVPYTGAGNIGLISKIGGGVLDLVGILDYLNVRSDFDNMTDVINYYTDCYVTKRKQFTQKLLAKCPDGSYRIESASKRDFLYWDMQLVNVQEDYLVNRCNEYMQNYQRCLINSLLTDLVTFGIGKRIETLIKGAKFVNKISEKAFLHFAENMNTLIHPNAVANTLTFHLSAIANTAIEGVSDIFDFKNFGRVRDNMLEFASKEHIEILKYYSEMGEKVEKAYKKCSNEEDEEDDEPLDEKSNDKPVFLGGGSTGILDPSGYVYEAVLSNRLEGVTATCYQKIQAEDMYGDTTEEAVIWNAEEYSQQNPLKTDKNGFYRWDVPQGMWQVKYEKEGYETAYSEWLPVPPPQLDVNIAMKQSTPPTVKQMSGTESGITIDMTKYMLPSTMSSSNITVTRNGENEHGTIEMLNAEQAPLSGETYVQKVKFIPDSRFHVTDDVVVTVHKEVQSYCGVTMTSDYQETVKIESEITDIVVDEEVTVPYRGERELRVLVMPKEAAAGRKLLVQTSSSMIASVSATEVTVGEDGAATVVLEGELPGGAVIEFVMDGSDVTATSKIHVKNIEDMVALPEASIPNGEMVVKGTKVALSCATVGATIYYTLDGSCPCDEAHRILYTEPITIDENVIIKAIAVFTDMYDSDVVEYRYTISNSDSRISEIVLDGNIDLYPLPMKDVVNVRIKDKKIDRVFITNTEGKVMLHSSKSSEKVSLDVHTLPSGIYIINVSISGNIFSRKVIKQE